VGNAFVKVSGGLEVGASGEVLVDHGLSGAKCLVLDGFDIAFIGINTHNVVFTLLLKNKSSANAKSADAKNGYVVFGESHYDGMCFSTTIGSLWNCS
jgi:hypothetical protein